MATGTLWPPHRLKWTVVWPAAPLSTSSLSRKACDRDQQMVIYLLLMNVCVVALIKKTQADTSAISNHGKFYHHLEPLLQIRLVEVFPPESCL